MKDPLFAFVVMHENWKFILVCVVCVFWPPFSLACLNYYVVGFQPQAVANPEPRHFTSAIYLSKPPYANICMP